MVSLWGGFAVSLIDQVWNGRRVLTGLAASLAVCCAAGPQAFAHNALGVRHTSARGGAASQVEINRAAITARNLMRYYYAPSVNLYHPNYPLTASDNEYSYLWPYTEVVAGLGALVAVDPRNSVLQKELVRSTSGFQAYWATEPGPPSYDSGVVQFGGGTKFYDDNEWVGMDYVSAYHDLHNPVYLAKAETVFRFVQSGWSNTLGGGIYWEQGASVKNTCSNGPGAVLAMQLYAITHRPSYMAWAKKILAWTKSKLYNPVTGLYWDHINSDGSVNTDMWSYNTGSVIQANVLLFDATHQKAYLHTALTLASASLNFFGRWNAQAHVRVFPDTPWFNVILLRSYMALYRADPKAGAQYVRAMRNSINYAWVHDRNKKGLFGDDWSGQTQQSNTPSLLTQSAMVEAYSLLATLPEKL